MVAIKPKLCGTSAWVESINTLKDHTLVTHAVMLAFKSSTSHTGVLCRLFNKSFTPMRCGCSRSLGKQSCTNKAMRMSHKATNRKAVCHDWVSPIQALNGAANTVAMATPIKMMPMLRPMCCALVALAMLNTAKAKNAPCGMPLKKRNTIKTSALPAKELLKLPKKHHMLKKTKILCFFQWRQNKYWNRCDRMGRAG